MKVKQLIEILKKLDSELEVITEGCDCWGDVGGYEVDTEENIVLLKRS